MLGKKAARTRASVKIININNVVSLFELLIL